MFAPAAAAMEAPFRGPQHPSVAGTVVPKVVTCPVLEGRLSKTLSPFRPFEVLVTCL